jgi:heptosyltransferase I
LHSGQKHELANYSFLLKSIFGIDEKLQPKVIVPSLNVVANKVVIHTTGGGKRAALRSPKTETWYKLCAWLLENNFSVFLTGATSDKSAIELWAKELVTHPHFTVVAGESMANTIAHLQQAFLVISVDTGIMHLASAMQKNLVSLHGPAPAWRWGPTNSNSIPLEPENNCLGCSNLGFEPCVRNEICIHSIPVERIEAAVLKFFS